MSNRIGARILAETLRPSFIAGSNFHFLTASKAGLSNAGSELFLYLRIGDSAVCIDDKNHCDHAIDFSGAQEPPDTLGAG